MNDVATVVTSILVAIVGYYILRFLLKNVFRGYSENFVIVASKIRKPAFVLLIFLAIMLVIPALDNLHQDIAGLTRHSLSILIIADLAWLSIRLVSSAKIIIVSFYDTSEKDNLLARKINTQFGVIERVLVFVIIILAIGIALMTFETIQQVGMSLLASAGIAGIVIGFAAQRVISTVLAGFQIAFTQPIRLDDVVIVEGEWGRIEEITLTYVVVKIWDKRRLIVPTTYFIETPFQNWTRRSSEILGTVFIYTDYNVSFETLRKELTRLLESSEYWDGEVNVIQVTDAKQNTLEIRALMSAADASQAWNLRVYVREKLIEFIQKNYPSSLPRTRVEFTDALAVHNNSSMAEKASN